MRISPIRSSSSRRTDSTTPTRRRRCATSKWINIQVARSRDLIHWEHLGDALPEKPGWARGTQDFWAPYVIQDGDRYLMYYSATPDVCDVPERGHCLAIASATSPAGPFVDMGMPLLLGMGFEYIDPMVFDDPISGKRFLYWGSGFQPIKVQQLAEDHMSFEPGSEPVGHDLAESGEGRLPAARRSRLGDPPR